MRVRVTNIPKILKPGAGRMLREELEKAADHVGHAVKSRVQTEIHASKPYAPIDEGALVTGVAPIVTGLKVRVAPSPVTQPYAIVQEKGRTAGAPGPPLAPILAWVERKLGKSGAEARRAAGAIRKKLHEKGMPGRGFFARARAATRKLSKPFVLAAVSRWKRRVKA
jgi:hypothetical protein